MKIISLVPSISDTLCQAGLKDAVVGCTKFCVEPASLWRSAKVLGGTKDFSLSEIDALEPSHIFANQEENSRPLVENLQTKYPVHVSYPVSPHDVPAILESFGTFLGQPEPFARWAAEISEMLLNAQDTAHRRPRPKLSFLYFIWSDPYIGRNESNGTIFPKMI